MKSSQVVTITRRVKVPVPPEPVWFRLLRGAWVIVAMAAMCIIMVGCWEVSDGERAGIVTKFSHKGMFFTTWEGELHYAGANGTIVADTWTFSLDNSHKRGENVAQLAADLTEAQRSGKRVKLTYKQEWIAAPWRGDHNYFIQSVEVLE